LAELTINGGSARLFYGAWTLSSSQACRWRPPLLPPSSQPPAFLDNAAGSLVPQRVIDAVSSVLAPLRV
jgi:selenocysteine lyase/cysteine desulfurase